MKKITHLISVGVLAACHTRVAGALGYLSSGLATPLRRAGADHHLVPGERESIREASPLRAGAADEADACHDCILSLTRAAR